MEPLSKNRLAWRCRRGMLELDHLLQNYLDTRYGAFTSDDLQGFQKLLDTPDALLLEYLLGQTVPVDPVVLDAVQKVRDAAAH